MAGVEDDAYLVTRESENNDAFLFVLVGQCLKAFREDISNYLVESNVACLCTAV